MCERRFTVRHSLYSQGKLTKPPAARRNHVKPSPARRNLALSSPKKVSVIFSGRPRLAVQEHAHIPAQQLVSLIAVRERDSRLVSGRSRHERKETNKKGSQRCTLPLYTDQQVKEPRFLPCSVKQTRPRICPGAARNHSLAANTRRGQYQS